MRESCPETHLEAFSANPTEPEMTGHTVVIGAGIVGVSTAIWLRRAGVEVTLVDRLGPGQGTSYGNAGVLAAVSVAPVTAPGLIRKAPGMLLSKDAPLFLRWAYLPRLVPWLMKYLGHANDAHTRRIAKALTPIVADTVEQHLALTRELGLEDWVTPSDYAFAYRDREAFEAESYTWALRREAGFEPRIIEGAAVRDYEPHLRGAGFVAAMQDHGFIRDPGGYVAALADRFHGMGGQVRQAEVRDFDLSGGQVRAVETTTGRIECSHVVLATGVWSKPMMRKLGLDVPLESERGYHIVHEKAENGPTRPIMIASGKFVATPMAAGVRCAGVLEFGGLDAGPSRAHFEFMRRQTRAAFPDMTCAREVEWMGHRPAPSDSLPLIGEIGQSRVFAAFGHHHIGLTGGPKTGRLVAGLIAGQPANMDLAAYAPQRFAR
jgi:D-amino-acid dehydrogenase